MVGNEVVYFRELQLLIGFWKPYIFLKISGLKLMGSTVLSTTRIILLFALKCLEHHETNFGTPKNLGMHRAFTNPIALICLEVVSSTSKSEYQL